MYGQSNLHTFRDGWRILFTMMARTAESPIPGWRSTATIHSAVISRPCSIAIREVVPRCRPAPQDARAWAGGSDAGVDASVRPRVSILINNHNYARYLPEAIESALRQTWQGTEVIVVDDGSTDDSLAVISRYDGRLTSIAQPNRGQAAALNAGFSHSTGDLVIFLDADDRLLPDACERAISAWSQHPTTGKIQFRMQVIDAAGNTTGQHKPSPHARLLSGDLRRHYLAFPDDVWRMPTSGNAFPAWVLHRICPIPEGDYRQGADTYLTHLAPLYGPVVSIESVEADYRVHGANGFELSEATLNLDRIRRNITHSAKTRRHLLATASKLGLNQSWRGQRVESVSFYINRMISLKFDPERHPICARIGCHASCEGLGGGAPTLRRGLAHAVRILAVVLRHGGGASWIGAACGGTHGLSCATPGSQRLAAALGRPISEPRLMRRVPASAREAWLVVFNAGSLVGSIVINAGLGFVFWWLAARTFEPANVGLAAATIAAMTLFGTLGVLGLGTLLIGELARRDHDKWALITTAMMTAGLAGAALGLAFVVVAPIISPDLAVLRSSPGIALLFAVGTAFTAASLVLDNALIGLLRGGIQLGRNAVFGVAKLATLVAAIGLVSASGMVIFGAWVVGAGLAAARRPFVARLRRPQLAARSRPASQAVAGPGSLCRCAPRAQRIDAGHRDAHATGCHRCSVDDSQRVLLHGLHGGVPHLHCAVGPGHRLLRARCGRTVGDCSAAASHNRTWLVAAVAGNLVLVVAAEPVLRLFGESYATEALGPLQLLALQAFTFVVREHYVAVKRVEATPAAAAPLVLAGAALKIAMAMVGAVAAGLTGLALGIVVASVIEAALMAPTLIRAAGRRAPGVGIASAGRQRPQRRRRGVPAARNERAVRPGGR